MRIASTQFHTTMNTALQKASSRLEDILQKMASGEKYSLPSEHPVTTVRMSRLYREEAALDQYRDNIGALQARLTQNEVYLSSMSNDMLSARDLLVWAADGSNTSEDVSAMAESLQPLLDSLFYVTNSTDAEGRYIFSGTAVATPTVTYDATAAVGSRYTYTGNTEVQRVVVGPGVTQPANVSLPEVATLLNQLEQVLATLQTPGVNVNDAAVRTQITTAMDGLDDVIESISGRIAGLGGSQNILATLETSHANVSLSNQQAALTLGQLDYSDAAVKLSGYTTAVQATQKAYAEVSKLSLFDVI
ncbi:flagellar hook-associated protein FlgL [Steroidobacter sp.]|uniref:flagellar hook-associated protein FlgL n=1 Tax=Steroidobacter sp. TaxID=1978227 RepID=UPI001A38A8AE|nr:flagellar hook-associated protein FlgL [Steroidobacter sp.]MBL8265493.1 flagellar hook-associated protein FlgL [Steroidobacter sp.]